MTVNVIPGPVFTTQPSTSAQNLCLNTTAATLTVVAAPATSYQWYTDTIPSNSGGTLISGATNSSYSPPTTTVGTLYYYCVVTSGCNRPSNVSGAVTVYPANSIPTILGGSSNVCYNTSPGAFTANGSGGSGTYTYLWYLGGVSTGITTQTYDPGNLIISTNVYCAVTSCGTSLNSSTFPISVISAPATVTATPPTICPGTPTSLSATAPGFIINWYTTSSGGTLLGTSASGGNFVVYPITTTTYYAESSIPAITTYNFTTCGVTGRLGPTQAQVTGAYASTILAGQVTESTQGIQLWTIPTTGTYSFQLNGASGGSETYAGYGAQVNGTLSLTAGTVLDILVGQMGSSHATAYSDGGGGASFVATGGTIYFAAGGGGGSAQSSVAGQNASTTTSVVSSSPSSFGSAGAGYSTNGANFTYGTYTTIAQSFTNGGNGQAGGQAGGWPGTDYGDGGFGGGGSSCSCSTGGGGGGGGYVGGGGGGGSYTSGYGGSSYIILTATSTSASVLSAFGNGSVTITFHGGGCVSNSRTPVIVNMAIPITFTTQPSNVAQNICLNGSASALTVIAAPVASYQWYSNTTSSNSGGIAISGATNSSFTPLTTNAGTLYYYCVVSDSACSLPSNVSGAITVYPANGTPTLSGANSYICYNTSPGVFTANGIGGSGAYTYLWYKGGVSTGITTQTYDPGNLTSSTTINCIVTSCGTSQNSATFPVSVISAPSPVTATPPSICPGSSSSLSAIAPGYSIYWYDASSGGTLLGSSLSGSNFVVSPTTATTYYAESEYGGVSTQTFTYTDSITTWTVPNGITSLTIEAKGASGGYTSGSIPGFGADMTGTFTVTPGQVFSILVGQSPGLTTLFPGGGGGTFVADGAIYATANPLIVAGGGGAAYDGYTAVGAPVTTSGFGLIQEPMVMEHRQMAVLAAAEVFTPLVVMILIMGSMVALASGREVPEV